MKRHLHLTLLLLICLSASAQNSITVQRIYLQQTTEPSTPSVGYSVCWADPATLFYTCKDSTGAKYLLTSSVASGAAAPAGTCSVGALYLRNDTTNSIQQLYVCAPTNTWQLSSYITGTSDPTNCAAGQLLLRTDSSVLKYCSTPGTPGSWSIIGGVSSPSTNGVAYWNGTSLTTTPTGGAGTLCNISTNGGAPTWASCAGSASTVWSALTNPSANLSLSMGTNTTGFTWSTGTSTSNLLTLQDTTGNTGTGYLLDVHSVGTSTAKPVRFCATGTTICVSLNASGLFAAAGGAGISATHLNGTQLSGLSSGILRNTTSTGVPTASELSGDATTSGSNAVTVVGLNGTSLGGLSTGLLKNTTSTGVPTIATAGTDYAAPTTAVCNVSATSGTITLDGNGSGCSPSTSNPTVFQVNPANGSTPTLAISNWKPITYQVQITQPSTTSAVVTYPSAFVNACPVVPDLTVTTILRGNFDGTNFTNPSCTSNSSNGYVATSSISGSNPGVGYVHDVFDTSTSNLLIRDTSGNFHGTINYGTNSTKFLTVNNILTLSGTDSTTMTFPSVSASIPGIGIGNTWTATQVMTHLTVEGVTSTGATGTGRFVFDGSPTLITPVLGAATATTINKLTLTQPATGATLTIPDGVTLTGPAASGTAMTLGNTETVTGNKTYTGKSDASGATHTLPAVTGVAGSRPGTCTVGEMYFATDATAGQNWYYCTATNTWTQQLNSGGSGSGAAGSTLFSATGSATVTATSATSLIGAVSGSTTVPINTFTAGQFMEIYASGYYTTPATPASLTIDLKIGGSVRITTGSVLQIASVTSGTWRLHCGVTTRTAGVSGTQIANCIFEGTGASLTPGESPLQTSSTWTIDTTATQAVDIAATWSTTTGAPTITSTNVAAWIPGAPVTSVSIDGGSAQVGVVALTSKVTSVQSQTGTVTLFNPNPQTSTYQAVASDFSQCKVVNVASGTFTVTLVASGIQPPAGQCMYVINYGSGVVTIARSGQNINGGTTSLTLSAASATAPTGAFVVSNGTDYFAQLFGVSSASGTVNTGTATHLGYYATSTNAISDMGADFTFSSHTLAGGASSILDLHLAATSGFLFPGGLSTGLVTATTSTGAVSTVAAPTGTVVGTSDTQTLTNKRINPRVDAPASGSATTYSANTDNFDASVVITSSTTSFTLSFTGTPVNWQTYKFSLQCTSTTTFPTLTFTGSVSGTDVSLPATCTGNSKIDNFGLRYDTINSTWELLAVARGY